MPAENQRLIEVWMPLRQIGTASQREKSMRRGHLSTLHQWWSRKPLVASRAAVFASLLDVEQGLPPELQDALLGLSECTPTIEAIAAANEQLQAAHETAPVMLDPFSGGGSIPLEALRLGCRVIANDINPVAHVLLHCTLHYPQRWHQHLADDVSAWGEWIHEQVSREVADVYHIPTPDQEDKEAENPYQYFKSSAYLWTREVTCHNPSCGAKVPLLRKSWLSRRPGRYIALRVIPQEKRKTVTFRLVTSKARSQPEAIAAFGFDPGAFAQGGHTSCMFCGAAVPATHVREEGKAGRLGLRLMAVACTQEHKRGKHYIQVHESGAAQPCPEHIQSRLEQLCRDTGLTLPDEPLPAQGSLGVSVQNYGMTKWSDLYTPRQLLVLLTFCKWVRKAFDEVQRTRETTHPGESPEERAAYAKAISTYLALGVTKIANRGSTLVIYNPNGEKLESPISNGRMSFNWDVAEVNPLGNASGNYRENLKYTVEALRSLCFETTGQSQITIGPAQWLSLDDQSVDIVVTDPPYYDNVPYSSLADYFYIWLKRMLEPLYEDALALPLTPKKRELVVDHNKHKGNRKRAHEAFEAGMGEALGELHRVLKDDGLLVLIYAHKTTLGWSSLIDALKHAQFEVTEAWPITTERAARLRAQGAAALASSIFLTARKRTYHRPGSLTTEIYPDLKQIVTERVHTLFDNGIQGTDLVIACVGAGLRAFTRYPSVEQPNGATMDTAQYLEEVQREVVAQILSKMMGIQDKGIAHIDALSQFYTIARFQFGEALMPYDEANTLAKGLGLELTNVSPLLTGRKAIALKRGNKLQLRSFQERGESCQPPPLDLLHQTPLIDMLHRLLWLLDEEPQRIPLLLDEWSSVTPRLRLLAQALAGRTFDADNPQQRPQRSPEEQQIDILLMTPSFRKVYNAKE